MSKRWKFEEDLMLAQFIETIGSKRMAGCDFICTEKEVENREKYLKKIGIFDELKKCGEAWHELRMEYLDKYGELVKPVENNYYTAIKKYREKLSGKSVEKDHAC